MKRIYGLVLAMLMAVVPTLGQAIGLGQINVRSALDEPLFAEISFTSLSAKERKKLKVELASRAEFSEAGISRPAHLTNIKFDTVRHADGRYYLQLRTDQPYREPFLHLLLKAEWAGGRLIREYTALIDPPYLVAGSPVGVSAPTVTPAPVVQAPQPEPIAPTPVPQPVAAAPPQVAQAQPEPIRQPKPATAPQPEPKPEPVMAQRSTEPETLFGPQTLDEAVISPSGWPLDEKQSSEPAPAKVEALVPADRGHEATIADMEPPAEEVFGPPVISEMVETPDRITIKRGDTLWQVADSLRSDASISVEQVAMAIYRNNPNAFFSHNVNNLKAGKILVIPDPEAYESQDPKQSRQAFRSHYDAWQEHKLKLASAQYTIPVDEAEIAPRDSTPEAMTLEEALKQEMVQEASKQEAAPQVAAKTEKTPKAKAKPAAKKETKPAKKPAGSMEGMPADDLLKIVRSNLEEEQANKDKVVADSESSKDTAKQEQMALADKVASLEESLASKEIEHKDLGQRAGQVSEQLEKQERLLELESQSMAQGEPVAEGADKAPKEVDAKEAPPITSVEPATKPAAKARAKLITPPPPERGLIEDILESITSGGLFIQIAGGVFVLLVGAIVLVYFRRRQQANVEFEESILNSAMDSEGTITDSGDSPVDTGDTSFLSDFSQGGMGNVSTDEVDPVAEAEVYLAYGRDEQAEEILKEAIVKDPVRQELKEKLLEIYSGRGDVGAFETLAEELYAALEGRGGQVWDRVAEMGKKLNPSNPMFGEGRPPAPSEDTDTMSAQSDTTVAGLSDQTLPGGGSTGVFDAFGDTGEMSGDDMAAESAGGAGEMELDIGGEDSESVLDFGDLDTTSGEGDALDLDGSLDLAAAEGAEDSGVIDFDMGGDIEEAPAPVRETPDDGGLSLDSLDQESEDIPSLDLADEDEGAIDFSLDADLGEADISTSSSSEAAPAAEEEAIEWDIETNADTGSTDEGGLDMTGDIADAALGGEAGFDMETESDVAVVEAGEEGEEISEQWDETATKLDLARAYIDMGDAEGARSILDEVLAEGNDEQKKQAQELAAQIS